MKVTPNTSGWQFFKTACIGISLHSANHRDGALEGLLSWADGRFDNIIIDLSDTLHRYNYMARGMGEDEARSVTRREGDDWLSRVEDRIARLKTPSRVTRWDEWLGHPDYASRRASFQTAFDTQSVFREAVEADILEFMDRRQVSNENGNAWTLSGSYLLEEISVHSIVYGENACAVLYPGKQHKCYEVVRKGLVPGAPDGLSNSRFVRMVVRNFDSPSY